MAILRCRLVGLNSFAVKNLEHRTQGAHLGVPDTVDANTKTNIWK